jgi:hypothetical protein
MEDSFRKGTTTREEYNTDYSILVLNIGETIEKWKI